MVITASVLVDADFEGVLTNTVVIDAPGLPASIQRHAVAYVTAQPVLRIEKTATPDPVGIGERLTYRLQLSNMGQMATGLVVTDVLPANVTYVSGGSLEGDTVRWEWSVLDPGERVDFSFQVIVTEGSEVVNGLYGVRCAEGVEASGVPVVTPIKGAAFEVFLPVVVKQAP